MDKSLRFGSALCRRSRWLRSSPAAPLRNRASAARASAARPTRRTSASRRARWSRSTPTIIAGRGQLRRAGGREQPERRRLPRLARQCLFRLRAASLRPRPPIAIRCRCYPNQPQVVLKLALVQIAQGKNAEALAFLDAARDVLDPADYGLALALAGQPQDAVAVLEPAARATRRRRPRPPESGAGLCPDRRLDAARTVASQDLSGRPLDARIQQWMTFAKPARRVRPGRGADRRDAGAADPGQPVRLALQRAEHARRRSAAGQPPSRSRSPQPRRAAAGRRLSPSRTPVVPYVPRRSSRRRCAGRRTAVAAAPLRSRAGARSRLRRSARREQLIAAAAAGGRRSAGRAGRTGRAARPRPRRSRKPRRLVPRRAARPAARQWQVDRGRPARRLRLAGSASRVAWNDAARRYAALRDYHADERPLRQRQGHWSIACRSRASPAPAQAKDLCAVAAPRRAATASSARSPATRRSSSPRAKRALRRPDSSRQAMRMATPIST